MNQDKPWLNSYPDGVPHQVDGAQFESLNDLFAQSFAQYGSRFAFDCMGKKITYKELDELSWQFAAYLQSQGLKKGDRIALMMPNLLQYPIALLGSLRAGCVVVNVNPMYTARELAYQLNDSGADALVILENFAHVFQGIQDQVSIKHVLVTNVGELMGLKGHLINWIIRNVKKAVPSWSLNGVSSFQEALQKGKNTRSLFVPVSMKSDDIAFLQYTGGTTGVAKGAVLLHRNILANIAQIDAWLEPGIRGLRIEQMVFVCALPMYHIFALTACCLFGIKAGGLNILVTNPRDIAGFVKLLKGLKEFHVFPAVNTLFNALMNHPKFSSIDFSSLLVSIGGGMAVQKSVADRWQQLTGKPIAEGYGLSETSPVVCCNTPLIDGFTGTIGLPLPGTDVLILDNEERSVALGEPGEICIKGPQLMSGYWNRDAETKQSMTAQGFFKTGDIAYMTTDGYVKIIDRKKDTIVVSGFNVYPNEIEEVLTMMPEVLECAAVGVKDGPAGEAVKVFIVKKDIGLTESQVLEYCKTQLTNYKRPKFVEFRTELPKSTVGKILRRELRDN
ncbi:long-chain-fatty-acid--CoA ligase [Polynucleobacter cosmopolitanus]|uniref:Long-chain-fatty-acid--CoA ligase n=1 Tax=Polynucleobacter cosmopolitanus TaxID=351345 RepID=A0A229FXE0_9BURK|nr:long-chain-fatty-acid--CoA ligase [Polynucleobacter cosmopolitanus]OXL16099.1 long-chain fatty acid--CoA ligase [Polynucleobacter cosmopolitanus]